MCSADGCVILRTLGTHPATCAMASKTKAPRWVDISPEAAAVMESRNSSWATWSSSYFNISSVNPGNGIEMQIYCALHKAPLPGKDISCLKHLHNWWWSPFKIIQPQCFQSALFLTRMLFQSLCQSSDLFWGWGGGWGQRSSIKNSQRSETEHYPSQGLTFPSRWSPTLVYLTESHTDAGLTKTMIFKPWNLPEKHAQSSGPACPCVPHLCSGVSNDFYTCVLENFLFLVLLWSIV